MKAISRLSFGTKKVAIVGAGYVGSSIAYALTIRNLARAIVLINRTKSKAEGEALDIMHGIPYLGTASVYVGDYCDCADCDLIIITVGRNRMPGETRLNLLEDNSAVLREVIEKIEPHYNGGVIMIVSNPVDVLTMRCAKWMDLPNGRIIGTGSILDTSRFVRELSDYINLNTESVKGVIVGEHGDSQIPIWSRVSIAGVPIDEYCENVKLPWNDEIKLNIENSVKGMGAKIIASKGKTHYGIATCVCFLADAILNQHLTIATVTTPLEGEYGIDGVALSLPSILGVNGVEKRLVESWNDMETAAFIRSAETLRQFCV